MARSDDARWPARELPEHTGARLLRARRRRQLPGDARWTPALLAALELPREWTCGLVLPLPVRDGVLGLLLVARPVATPRAVAGRARGAGHPARARAGGRAADRGDPPCSAARRASPRWSQHSSDLITVVGADATITYQSPSSEHVLGYPPAGAAGHALRSPRGPRRRRPPAAAARRRLGLRAPRRRGDRVHAAPPRRQPAPVRDPAHQPARRRARARHRPERARHLRAQGLRGAARPPGVPRPRHQPAQPRAVRRARASRDRPRAARERASSG